MRKEVLSMNGSGSCSDKGQLLFLIDEQEWGRRPARQKICDKILQKCYNRSAFQRKENRVILAVINKADRM